MKIQPGKAVINGRMLVSDAEHTISIDPAESGKARFDIIALRLNVANKTVLPVVLKGGEVSASGVSSSNLPPSPALTSTNSTADGICDLALFKVYVTSSGTVITATSDQDGYDSDLRTIAVHPLTQALIDKFTSQITSETSARLTADTALGSRVGTLETFKNAEEAERATADTALGNRITTLETWKNAENSSDYKLVRLICPGGAISYGATLAICKNREETHGYMFRWSNNEYMTYCYTLYVYENTANVTFYKVSSPFGGGDLVLVSQSGGSATIIGTVKVVSA